MIYLDSMLMMKISDFSLDLPGSQTPGEWEAEVHW